MTFGALGRRGAYFVMAGVVADRVIVYSPSWFPVGACCPRCLLFLRRVLVKYGLGQFGAVKRLAALHLRQRQHGWQHYVTRNGVGKFAGGFVLLGV